MVILNFRYEECFDVYRDIIKNTEDDYEDERETNLSAVIANLYIEGSVSCYELGWEISSLFSCLTGRDDWKRFLCIWLQVYYCLSLILGKRPSISERNYL